MSKRFRAANVAILAGFLIWLGLSPRIAHVIYEKILMPRCRSDVQDRNKIAEIVPRPVSFRSGHCTLQGHLLVRPDSHKLIVYYGGRRSNLAKNMMRAKALINAGASVFVFEYRGFGDANGHASIKSLLEDGLAAHDATAALGYSPQDVFVYGESLGVAVAAHVAAKRIVAAMILQSGFSSLDIQMKDMVPLLRIYPRFLSLQSELSPAATIKAGHPPLLLMHGDEDSIVRRKHAEWLAKAAGSKTTLVILPGAGHGDMFTRQDWLYAVSAFLSSF